MNEKVIAILEVFEDLLDSKGIEIPCEDEREQDERHDGGNDAKIYGTEYGELYDAIEKILKDDKETLAVTSVNFTSEELTILSNALLRLMSSTQEAVKLINDLEIFEAIDKALNKYQRLNNKICDMESEISQEGEDET